MKEVLKQIPGLRKAVRVLKGKHAQDPREYLLSKMVKGSVCAEVGVHEGQFSRRIMQQVQPKRLHLIDPWEHEGEDTYQDSWYGGLGGDGQHIMDERCKNVKALFDDEISKERIVVHREYSNDAAENFDDNYFDWIYIDANHQYEFVKQDLEFFYSKVQRGGFITGDDYGLEGWWKNGVQKGVDEFVAGRDCLTLEVRGNQFIIKKEL